MNVFLKEIIDFNPKLIKAKKEIVDEHDHHGHYHEKPNNSPVFKHFMTKKFTNQLLRTFSTIKNQDAPKECLE